MVTLGIHPGGSEVKASACNAGDPGSTPGLGRSPREGNGNPLHYSCLENPMDGGAWLATVHGVPKSLTQLSNFTFTFYFLGIHSGNLESIRHITFSLSYLQPQETSANPTFLIKVSGEKAVNTF